MKSRYFAFFLRCWLISAATIGSGSKKHRKFRLCKSRRKDSEETAASEGEEEEGEGEGDSAGVVS